jgi:excisionase family DNA binding protein
MTDVIADEAHAGRSIFVDDAARLLDVSRRTVYYRIREGRLQTIRTRCGSQRVLVESVEALRREIAAKRKAGRTASEAEPLPLQIQPFS